METAIWRALLSLPVVFSRCCIAHSVLRVGGVKAHKLNSLILVLIPNHTRTTSSAWKYSGVPCRCGWRNRTVLLRGSAGWFYTMEKNAFSPPDLPASSSAPFGRAVCFYSCYRFFNGRASHGDKICNLSSLAQMGSAALNWVVLFWGGRVCCCLVFLKKTTR